MYIMSDAGRETMAEHSSDADTWHLRDARAHFSELVDKAVTRGPQVVTRHGKPAVVVVSAREWEHRNRRRGDLVEFFARSPLAEERVEIERIRDEPRDIEL